MDIYKRPGSPYWWFRFTVDGKEIRGSTKRPHSDQKGARKVLAMEYETAHNRTQFGEKPDITLAEAFDRAIEGAEAKKTILSYTLVKNRTLGLGSFNRKGWWSLDGNMPLAKLNEGHLEDLVRSRKKAGNSPNTINIDLRVIKVAVNSSRKRFRAPDDLTFPMLKAFEKTRFLTREEEELILASLRVKSNMTAYAKALDLFIFLIDTGVRLGEALSLTWPQVNMTDRTFVAYRTKTGSQSLVPLSDRAYAVLAKHRGEKVPFVAMSRAVRLLRKMIDQTCNTDPRLVSQRGGATIHSLRDTYASRLAQRGMSLHKVSKLLGHTTTTMTRKYAHLEPHEVAEEARRMLNAG